MPWRWRSDGDLCRDVPAVRRIMPLIMRGRNESVVFFEQRVDVTNALAFVEEVRQTHGVHATLLHLFLYAAARALHDRPRLNRFVSGQRIWQRRGIWLSFSAKKAKRDDAPIVVIKRRVDPTRAFIDVVKDLDGGVKEGRSDKKSSTDKELAAVFLLPMMMVRVVVRALMWLAEHGWLPRGVIDSDPLFASMFVANLGSIGMDAGYHHLYEYGNIPIFAVLGRAQDELVPDDQGGVRTVRRMVVKYSFDERIEDGLYCARALDRIKAMLEDPRAALGTGGTVPTDASSER